MGLDNPEPAPSVEATVLLSDSELIARLCDRRRNAHAFFDGIDNPQRPVLAAEAWSTGLRGLRNAQAAGEEGRPKISELAL